MIDLQQTNPCMEMWFPTIIYKAHLSSVISEEQNAEFYKKSLEYRENLPQKVKWRCNTYTSMDVLHLNDIDMYNDLIDICKRHVVNFSKFYGVTTEKIKCNEAWVNVSDPGAYQEYHLHPDRHFSLVYYVNAPEDCGKIVFRSHEAQTDMCSLPVTDHSAVGAPKTVEYVPKDREILIFRSNLLHMVEMNNSKETRVSFAMNFTLG